uniref:Uncharacterized protein n=2 Tax=Anguilla anguilla TaxID=7936 RepID=A0A0E9U7N1_ANGAN
MLRKFRIRNQGAGGLSTKSMEVTGGQSHSQGLQ